MQATRPDVLGVAGQLEGLLDLRLGDVGPAALPAVDALLGLEAVERLAHGRARDPEAVAELALGRHRGAGGAAARCPRAGRGAAGTSAVEIRQKTPLPASRPSASRLTTDGPYQSAGNRSTVTKILRLHLDIAVYQ